MAKLCIFGLLMILAILIEPMLCQTTKFCYTPWLDRDDPSGYGDYETVKEIPPGTICSDPIAIECQTTSGVPYDSTGK